MGSVWFSDYKSTFNPFRCILVILLYIVKNHLCLWKQGQVYSSCHIVYKPFLKKFSVPTENLEIIESLCHHLGTSRASMTYVITLPWWKISVQRIWELFSWTMHWEISTTEKNHIDRWAKQQKWAFKSQPNPWYLKTEYGFFSCILTPPAPKASLLKSIPQSITTFWLVLRFLLANDTLLDGLLMRLSSNWALQEQRRFSTFLKRLAILSSESLRIICALTRLRQYTSCACETS